MKIEIERERKREKEGEKKEGGRSDVAPAKQTQHWRMHAIYFGAAQAITMLARHF